MVMIHKPKNECSIKGNVVTDVCETRLCGRNRLKPFDYCEVCIEARADAFKPVTLLRRQVEALQKQKGELIEQLTKPHEDKVEVDKCELFALLELCLAQSTNEELYKRARQIMYSRFAKPIAAVNGEIDFTSFEISDEKQIEDLKNSAFIAGFNGHENIDPTLQTMIDDMNGEIEG
jgi:hypothetical protein